MQNKKAKENIKHPGVEYREHPFYLRRYLRSSQHSKAGRSEVIKPNPIIIQIIVAVVFPDILIEVE